MERTLILHYSPGKLTQNVSLVLTFQPPTNKALSPTQNLVAWKVVPMHAVKDSTAMDVASITYTGRLAFGVSREDVGNIILGASTVEMKVGEFIELEWQEEVPVWGIPSKAAGQLIKAKNDTPFKQNISMGTLQRVGSLDVYSPSFLWKVGSTQTAEADFHPVLKAYTNLGLVQNEFTAADISSDPIYQWNIPELGRVTNWSFAEATNGSYTITPIDSLVTFKASSFVRLAPHEPDISVASNLNWEESVPRHVVSDVFADVSSSLAAKGVTYYAEHYDKDRHRKYIVSQQGVTCEELSNTLKAAIFAALEKEAAMINGKVLGDKDFDLYWSITDEHGTLVYGADKEIIPVGSASWYYL
ncbi:hypothetical protein B0H16DRAFT_1535393, partial [Mycena metata]